MHLKAFFNFLKRNRLVILGIILVILVSLNFVMTYQVNTRVEDFSSWRLENEKLKNENAKLESINKALFDDAMARLLENKEMKHFLGGMENEISQLIELSQCVNCCSVAAKVVKMGKRLIYFGNMIGQFTR